MCTVSVIPTPWGYRLATNRDESRSRPLAERPSVRRAGEGRAIWPVDPSGGGTWVSASDRGLTLAILNLNEPGLPALPPAEAQRSRGLVIPGLAGAPGARAARVRLGEMDLWPFAAFRLMGVDPEGGFVARWDRRGLSFAELDGSPVCLASSGLGDEVVRERLPLFESLVVAGGPTVERQDAFHGHTWDDRPERSVMMSRAEARTVSTTVVEMREDRVVMRYRDDAGWAPAVEVARPRAGRAAGSGAAE